MRARGMGLLLLNWLITAKVKFGDLHLVLVYV